MVAKPKREVPWTIVLGLIAITLLVYWPALKSGFVSYDDPDFVTENPIVRAGLTWAGLKWAFTTGHSGNWMPLTWLSHMADCQFFGLKPVGHHCVSLLIHAANAALCFVLLRKLFGSVWQSAVVAALFAWHPLRVESVAWIAERKDVLCGLFWLLSMLMYVHFARANNKPARCKFYLLTIVCFVLGLMSKPMIVTLPLLLLLIDYWPLQRLNRLSWKGCALEKVPFVALSAIECLITLRVQTSAGAVRDFGVLPFSVRVGNAAVAIFRYVYKLVWPVDLAVLDPYQKSPAITVVTAAVAFLAASLLAVLLRKRFQWLAFGWLWFVLSLLPVIGLVQVGMQSMADRYTYMPCIGLFIAGSMMVVELLKKFSSLRNVAVAGTCLALSVCAWLTSKQLQFWRDSETLFTHTLAITENNVIIHNNLGYYLQEQGRVDEALAHFLAAEKIDHEVPETHNNLACVFLLQGKLDDSIEQSSYALKLRPTFAEAQVNLGRALFLKGDSSKSVQLLSAAVEAVPQNATAHFDLGEALIKVGQPEQALIHLGRALELDPAMNEARIKLASTFVAKGKWELAIEQYRQVLVYHPDSIEGLNNLAWILATGPKDNLRNGNEAIKLGERVIVMGGTNSFAALDTLAAANAEAGRFTDAIRLIDSGIPLAEAAGSPAAARMRTRRELYRDHRPYHEP
jgi:tetratricopeptide (TPR) repeat protein